MNQYRCETCNFNKQELGYGDRIFCTIKGGMTSVYPRLEEFIAVRGCASHSDFQIDRETLHLSSSDLLLIAHDEWKRREERKCLHDNISWVNGWISGFLTSRKFVRERVAELRQAGEP